MRKVILLAHTSLDGFVASKDGSLDGFEPGDENLAFVCKLTETADAALFGRVSYQLLQQYWPTAYKKQGATTAEIAYSNWYNDATKIVASHTMHGMNYLNTVFIKGNLENEINNIKRQPGKDILLFGSPSVTQSLMENNIIDEYWIFINPAIFGEGIPLFKEMKHTIKLQLDATKIFTNGETGLHYKTIR